MYTKNNSRIKLIMISNEVADTLNSHLMSSIEKYLYLKQKIYQNIESEANQIIDNLPLDSDNEELSALMILLKIEFILEFREIGIYEIESLNKMIQLSGAFPKGPFNVQNNPTRQYIRVKYNDLYNDFQYLFNPTITIFRFMELVNKKLTTLSNIPDTEDDNVIDLAVDLYLKVVDYCLLAGSDFRKKNILKFLDETLSISQVTKVDSTIANKFNKKVEESVRGLFTLLNEEKFILFKQYEAFLANSKAPIVKRIAKTNSSLLISNFLENNISLLPKYYMNIHLDKITQLFIIPTNLDIEALVSQMIISGKLPPGTCIDQMEQTLIFGEFQPDYSIFDSHVQEVSEMVDQIANLIHNTNL
ncbi:unnamed protein product [Debaryomyces fabryi]|nr:unnamed protein product [Debaryomyces fabryi]